MAPKREKKFAEGRLEKSGKLVQNLEEFNPNLVPNNDRISIILDFDVDLFKKYLDVVFFLRYSAAYGGSKCCSDKKYSKFKCGETGDYKTVFMMIDVFISEYEITLLVYKPSLYLLAICFRNKWWHASDFTAFTNLNFSMGNDIGYDSRYSKVPRDFSFEILKGCVMNFVNNEQFMDKTEDSFKTLCVFFCEPTRFDEIFYTIAPVMKSQTKTIKLDEFQVWVIQNWETLSKLWILWDLGYVWNVSDIKYPKINDERVACKVIGLLMYVKSHDILDVKKNYTEVEEEEEKSVEEKRVKRYRTFNLNDVNVLEDIRKREINKRVKKENARRSDVVRAVLDEYKFVEDMMKELEKAKQEPL